MDGEITAKKRRVAFFVDGYNLYHSIASLSFDDPSKNYLKWVDLRKLFSFFINPHEEELADIFFFTARPTHTRPDVQQRYWDLMIAYQRFLNIKVIFGKFKAKDMECKSCHVQWQHHEEKESDVNLAVNVVKWAYEKSYDTAYIVTQDSDMAPAVKLAEAVNPGRLRLLTPPNREHSRELARMLGRRAAKIQEIHLKLSLMPEAFYDKDGKVVVHRPVEYAPLQA